MSYDPEIPFLGISPAKIKAYVHTTTRTGLFIAAVFIRAPATEAIHMLSTDKWINKLSKEKKRDSIHNNMNEYQKIMLCGRNQIQKSMVFVLFHLHELLEKAKLQRQKEDG